MCVCIQFKDSHGIDICLHHKVSKWDISRSTCVPPDRSPSPWGTDALTFVTVKSLLSLTVSLSGRHLSTEALCFARFSSFVWIVMRAVFGDWLPGRLTLLLGAARARACLWLVSLPCVDGPHSSILLLRHAGPIPARGSGSTPPQAVSPTSLAFMSRSRTSGSRGALTFVGSAAVSSTVEHLCVPGPVLSSGRGSVLPGISAADWPVLWRKGRLLRQG